MNLLDGQKYVKLENGVITIDLKQAALDQVKPGLDALIADISSNKIELIPGTTVDNMAVAAALKMLEEKILAL